MKQHNTARWLLVMAALLPWLADAQRPPRVFTPVVLETRQHNGLEFSGLTDWEDRILFVSQLCQPADTDLYFAVKTHVAALVSLRQCGMASGTLGLFRLPILNKALLHQIGGYQGIEAAVVVDSEIIFAIETDDSIADRFIVKGNVGARGITLATENGRLLQLPLRASTEGTNRIPNAGFESLVRVPGQDQVIAFFELNHLRDTRRASAWRFRADLSGSPDNVTLEKRHYRLTDAAYENGTIYGLNFWYHGEKELDYAERLAYQSQMDSTMIIAADYDAAASALTDWRTVGVLPENTNRNQEGLCRFRAGNHDGFLIISDDNRNHNLICELLYVPLNP